MTKIIANVIVFIAITTHVSFYFLTRAIEIFNTIRGVPDRHISSLAYDFKEAIVYIIKNPNLTEQLAKELADDYNHIDEY